MVAGSEQPTSLLGLVGGASVISSLCCLPPVIIVLFGLSSISAAAALGDSLYYGPARWIFYGVSLLFLLLGLVFYFRQQGICTLDDARRQQNRILNTGLLVLAASVAGYLFLTYVILEAVGIRLGLPWEAWWD